MNKNKDTKEKICAFYASDYHFEMISLPYIDKEISNKNEVVILTQDNLEETMKTLLEKTNLKEDKKKQILKIGWQNNNLEKFNTIKTKINDEKDRIIFIKGNEKYIHQVNEKIEKCSPKENHIKIIDCYNIEEVGENLDKIMEPYHTILKITGEKEIEK